MKIRYDVDLSNDNFDEEEFKEVDQYKQTIKKHKIKTYKSDNKKRNKYKRGEKDVWNCD